jgi:predicted nucleic acid-binding protein
MIFVDTNVFLRFLTKPSDSASADMNRIASGLFERVASGEAEITTSEVVLHEVCYVMMSAKHYGLPAGTVVDLMRTLLNLKGFRFDAGEKSIYLRALDILASDPKLEYADAVIAARVERLGIPLATFDERLGNLASITRWQT